MPQLLYHQSSPGRPLDSRSPPTETNTESTPESVPPPLALGSVSPRGGVPSRAMAEEVVRTDRWPLVVVGAGPSGMTLAYEVAGFGIPVLVLEKRVSRSTCLRAPGIHARTLELMDERVGASGETIAQEMLARARWMRDFEFWLPTPLATSYATIRSRFNGIATISQEHTERILEQACLARGVQFRRGCEVTQVEQTADCVYLHVKRDSPANPGTAGGDASAGSGSEEILVCSFAVGCEGKKSIVRHSMGGYLKGESTPIVMNVADASITESDNPEWWTAKGRIFGNAQVSVAMIPVGTENDMVRVGVSVDTRNGCFPWLFKDLMLSNIACAWRNRLLKLKEASIGNFPIPGIPCSRSALKCLPFVPSQSSTIGSKTVDSKTTESAHHEGEEGDQGEREGGERGERSVSQSADHGIHSSVMSLTDSEFEAAVAGGTALAQQAEYGGVLRLKFTDRPKWCVVCVTAGADKLREGRLFIAGDAAHIHSPAGGQGLNFGVGDAINLGWKLGLVIKRGGECQSTAAKQLLDSYERERIPHIQQLLRTVRFLELINWPGVPYCLRVWIARIALSLSNKASKNLTQTAITYPPGTTPISFTAKSPSPNNHNAQTTSYSCKGTWSCGGGARESFGCVQRYFETLACAVVWRVASVASELRRYAVLWLSAMIFHLKVSLVTFVAQSLPVHAVIERVCASKTTRSLFKEMEKCEEVHALLHQQPCGIRGLLPQGWDVCLQSLFVFLNPRRFGRIGTRFDISDACPFTINHQLLSMVWDYNYVHPTLGGLNAADSLLSIGFDSCTSTTANQDLPCTSKPGKKLANKTTQVSDPQGLDLYTMVRSAHANRYQSSGNLRPIQVPPKFTLVETRVCSDHQLYRRWFMHNTLTTELIVWKFNGILRHFAFREDVRPTSSNYTHVRITSFQRDLGYAKFVLLRPDGYVLFETDTESAMLEYLAKVDAFLSHTD